MTYSRSLDKSFDGVRDMEITQTKKRTSSHACLIIVDKTKNIPNTQGKRLPLWFGFKVINVLNANEGLTKKLIRVL